MKFIQKSYSGEEYLESISTTPDVVSTSRRHEGFFRMAICGSVLALDRRKQSRSKVNSKTHTSNTTSIDKQAAIVQAHLHARHEGVKPTGDSRTLKLEKNPATWEL